MHGYGTCREGPGVTSVFCRLQGREPWGPQASWGSTWAEQVTGTTLLTQKRWAQTKSRPQPKPPNACRADAAFKIPS